MTAKPSFLQLNSETKVAILNVLRAMGLSGRALIISIETLRNMITSRKFLLAVLYFAFSLIVDAFTLSNQLILEKNDSFAMFKAQQLIRERLETYWFSTLGLLVILVLSADLISGEVERDTLHALYGKPITVAEIIMGKFLGTVLAFSFVINTILMTTFYLQATTFGASKTALYNTIDEVAYFVFISFLIIAGLVSLSLFFSVITSKTLQSALLSFVAVIGGPFIGLLLGLSPNAIEKTNIVYYGIGALKPAFFNLELAAYTWKWYTFLTVLASIPIVFLLASTIALKQKEIP